jgi:hypothetical protein
VFFRLRTKTRVRDLVEKAGPGRVVVSGHARWSRLLGPRQDLEVTPPGTIPPPQVGKVRVLVTEADDIDLAACLRVLEKGGTLVNIAHGDPAKRSRMLLCAGLTDIRQWKVGKTVVTAALRR